MIRDWGSPVPADCRLRLLDSRNALWLCTIHGRARTREPATCPETPRTRGPACLVHAAQPLSPMSVRRNIHLLCTVCCRLQYPSTFAICAAVRTAPALYNFRRQRQQSSKKKLFPRKFPLLPGQKNAALSYGSPVSLISTAAIDQSGCR